MMAPYSPEQMEEVWCWIHNEQRCVTTLSVGLQLGLPRSVAAELLSKIPSHKQQQEVFEYECTFYAMVSEDEVNGATTTVIQLQKMTISPNDMDTDGVESKFIYSLALKETETVHSAHEKDMVQFRDLLAEENSPHSSVTRSLDATLHQHDIQSEEFSSLRKTAHASQDERLSGRVAAPSHPTTNTAPAAPIGSKKAARKVTSAANFFAKKESTTATATAKKASPSKPSQSEPTKEPTPMPKSKTTQDAAAKQQKKGKQPFLKTQPMEIDKDEKVVTVSEEKENSENRQKIGNADDFVGDEDEDEDFCESERQRVTRRRAVNNKQKEMPAKRKSRKHPPKQPVENVNDDDDEEPKVHGAMDKFAQHQEKKSAAADADAADAVVASNHHKRRKKKLVDKTTMDANGYIHTETQVVWEDVSEDEAEAEEVVKSKTPATKTLPAKSTKNMKQGSLMGFFKKK